MTVGSWPGLSRIRSAVTRLRPRPIAPPARAAIPQLTPAIMAMAKPHRAVSAACMRSNPTTVLANWASYTAWARLDDRIGTDPACGTRFQATHTPAAHTKAAEQIVGALQIRGIVTSEHVWRQARAGLVLAQSANVRFPQSY